MAAPQFTNLQGQQQAVTLDAGQTHMVGATPEQLRAAGFTLRNSGGQEFGDSITPNNYYWQDGYGNIYDIQDPTNPSSGIAGPSRRFVNDNADFIRNSVVMLALAGGAGYAAGLGGTGAAGGAAGVGTGGGGTTALGGGASPALGAAGARQMGTPVNQAVGLGGTVTEGAATTASGFNPITNTMAGAAASGAAGAAAEGAARGAVQNAGGGGGVPDGFDLFDPATWGNFDLGSLFNGDNARTLLDVLGANYQYQANQRARDQMMELFRPYREGGLDYLSRLNETYENPASYLTSPEYQAIQNVTHNQLSRADAAGGRNANSIGRQAKLQELAMTQLGNFRAGLSNTMSNLGQIATGGNAMNAIREQQNTAAPLFGALEGMIGNGGGN